MAGSLPAIPTLSVVRRRLPVVFPEGVEHRGYCIRDVAARTIWAMFYAGAVEGLNRWLRPSMVTDMTDRQARKTAISDRELWYATASSSTKKRPAKAWFAPNSREQIRDETLRLGLIPNGAVIERAGLATTSSLPRYALASDFAELFDVSLSEEAFNSAARQWREKRLSKAALARIALLKKGVAAQAGHLVVTFPNGQTRQLAAGPSSVISKAVIEEFAPRYMTTAGVLWLSESASKVAEADVDLTSTLGLSISPDKNLPDIILVDLGKHGDEVLFAFVEVVATDGPINDTRKKALLQIATAAGFNEGSIVFLTAFEHRGAAAFKKAIADLAIGTFAWFMAEPDSLLILRSGGPVPLSALR